MPSPNMTQIEQEENITLETENAKLESEIARIQKQNEEILEASKQQKTLLQSQTADLNEQLKEIQEHFKKTKQELEASSKAKSNLKQALFLKREWLKAKQKRKEELEKQKETLINQTALLSQPPSEIELADLIILQQKEKEYKNTIAQLHTAKALYDQKNASDLKNIASKKEALEQARAIEGEKTQKEQSMQKEYSVQIKVLQQTIQSLQTSVFDMRRKNQALQTAIETTHTNIHQLHTHAKNSSSSTLEVQINLLDELQKFYDTNHQYIHNIRAQSTATAPSLIYTDHFSSSPPIAVAPQPHYYTRYTRKGKGKK